MSTAMPTTAPPDGLFARLSHTLRLATLPIADPAVRHRVSVTGAWGDDAQVVVVAYLTKAIRGYHRVDLRVSKDVADHDLPPNTCQLQIGFHDPRGLDGVDLLVTVEARKDAAS